MIVGFYAKKQRIKRGKIPRKYSYMALGNQNERKTNGKGKKMKNEFLFIKKKKRTAVLVPGKTKQRKNEKKRNFSGREGFPTNIFLVGNYGLRRAGRWDDTDLRRACPPEWARSKIILLPCLTKRLLWHGSR